MYRRYDTKVLGTTSDGWKIKNPPTMTTLAEDGYLIERLLGGQQSIIERRKSGWVYMRKFDTKLLPERNRPNHCFLTICGRKVEKTESLQTALEGLGMNSKNASEAIRIMAEVA